MGIGVEALVLIDSVWVGHMDRYGMICIGHVFSTMHFNAQMGI